MSILEIALAILFLILCGLTFAETRGYIKYIEAQKQLIEAYGNQAITVTAVLGALTKMNESQELQEIRIKELEADNDIMRVMIDTLCDVNGVKLPHLQVQLHNHDAQNPN